MEVYEVFKLICIVLTIGKVLFNYMLLIIFIHFVHHNPMNIMCCMAVFINSDIIYTIRKAINFVFQADTKIIIYALGQKLSYTKSFFHQEMTHEQRKQE